MILDKILHEVRRALEQKKHAVPLAEMQHRARSRAQARPFVAAVDAAVGGMALIAELKKASPSAGELRQSFDVAHLAQQLRAGGADALSVLTEPHFFQGSLDNLAKAASAGLPKLRKDFLVDRYQVFEARAHGADAVLLIAEALTPEVAGELAGVALELGMDVLLETHAPQNVPWVADLAARHPDRILLGINNRDLRTFAVSLETTFGFLHQLPAGVRLVSESGIQGAGDVARLHQAGVRAILVGETLMRASDVESAARHLMSQVRGDSS